MNQSVQFSFSKTVVLNSSTHVAIHKNKKQKKWKLNYENFSLFLYPFLSSLIRKGSLTSCEEELREVRWFQLDFDITNNYRQKCWAANTLYLFSFFSAPGPLLNKIQFIIIIILFFSCFWTLNWGGLLKGKTIFFNNQNELLLSFTVFATTFVQDFWLIFYFLSLWGPEDKGNWK